MARRTDPLTEDHRKLIEDNFRLVICEVNKRVQRFKQMGYRIEYGDVMSAAHAIACNAARTWRPEIAKWTTYLTNSLRRSLSPRLFRDRTGIKNVGINQPRLNRHPLSDEMNGLSCQHDDECANQELTSLAKDALNDLLRNAKKRLPNKTWKIVSWKLGLEGESKSYSELAKEFGVSTEMIRWHVNRGKKLIARQMYFSKSALRYHKEMIRDSIEA